MQLEPRDTRGIEKADEKEAEDVERGREIREAQHRRLRGTSRLSRPVSGR